MKADPHYIDMEGLVPVHIVNGKVMWVRPDIAKDQEWTTATRRKSKGKIKTSCNVVISTCIKEDDADVASLTDYEEEKFTFIAEQDIPPATGTRSGKDYLKKYDETVESSSKTAEEPTKQPLKKAKSKDLCYIKAV